MAVAKKKLPRAEINGGQWRFSGVLELKDGTIIEATRFEALYAESFFKQHVKADNVGSLLRDRTREVLRKTGV